MANIYDERSENHAGYNEGTKVETTVDHHEVNRDCLLYTSPSPRD